MGARTHFGIARPNRPVLSFRNAPMAISRYSDCLYLGAVNCDEFISTDQAKTSSAIRIVAFKSVSKLESLILRAYDSVQGRIFRSFAQSFDETDHCYGRL